MYKKLLGVSIAALSLTVSMNVFANIYKQYSVTVKTVPLNLVNTKGYRIYIQGAPSTQVSVWGNVRNVVYRGLVFTNADNFLKNMIGGTQGKGYSPYLMQTTPVTFTYVVPGMDGGAIDYAKFETEIIENQSLATLTIYNTDWSVVKTQACPLRHDYQAGDNVIIYYGFDGLTKATQCYIN